MFLKYYFLYNILTFLVTIQSGEAIGFCFDSSRTDSRLNATVIKVKGVSLWVRCVMDCVLEPCCRSINYNRDLHALENGTNCEMLHDVLNSTSEELLQKNASYHYVQLTDPQKEYNHSCLSKHLDENITDIDGCLNKSKNTCAPNATCTNTESSYVCQCKVGYSGDGKICADIDQCLNKSKNTCDPNANCTNTEGSYVCQCKVGYAGDGKTCTDINECSKETHKCDSNADCTNTEGSYNCTCREGYYGNGTTCKVLVLGSVILSSEPLNFTKTLKEWLPKTGNWSACWRATRDGWNVATTFHRKCDGKKPTLTIVKVVKDNKNYIFGGYATESWAGTNRSKTALGSFVFSLRNKDNLSPFKAPLISRNSKYAMYCSKSHGPTFAGGFDLHIANNADSNRNSYTKLGHTYQAPPGYRSVSDNTKSLLAGSHYFTPSEVEVLYLPD